MNGQEILAQVERRERIKADIAERGVLAVIQDMGRADQRILESLEKVVVNDVLPVEIEHAVVTRQIPYHESEEGHHFSDEDGNTMHVANRYLPGSDERTMVMEFCNCPNSKVPSLEETWAHA